MSKPPKAPRDKGWDILSSMTQPNQSELEQLLDCLYEKGYDAGDGMSKYPKDIAILETEVKIERLITANYTPNATVEQLKSRIAWLEGKVEGLSNDNLTPHLTPHLTPKKLPRFEP